MRKVKTETCACSVTADQFASLSAQVQALQATIDSYGSLEATVNDVITAQTDMATCMADAVARFDVDTTEGPATTSRTVVTAEPSEETTTVASDVSDLGTLVTDGYDSSIDNRCGLGPGERAFRLDFTSLENCMQRCIDDARCIFATHNNDVDDGIGKYCIGCIELTSWTEGWVVYEVNNEGDVDATVPEAAPVMEGRRQLTQLQLLEEENAALKDMINELREELRRL